MKTIAGKMLSLLTIVLLLEISLCQNINGPTVGPMNDNSIANTSTVPSAQVTHNMTKSSAEEPQLVGNELTANVSNTQVITDKSVIIVSDQTDNHQDSRNSSRDVDSKRSSDEVTAPTNVTSNETEAHIQKGENVTMESDMSPSSGAIDANSTQESHRINKRSFSKRNALHMNLDELINRNRKRRSSMRFKRDNARDEVLAQLLFGNANQDKSEDETDDSDGDNAAKYIDRDTLLRLYNAYLPYLVTRDDDSGEQEENNLVEEPTIMVDEFGNAVLTSRNIPHYPNRYERILSSLNNPEYRRSFRKRSDGYRQRWGYGFGRIMPTRRDRTAYDEANKIYMISSLLARAQGVPQQRTKRWVKRSVRYANPVIKNM